MAQKNTTLLKVSQDSLNGGNGELVGTTLKLINLGTRQFEGKLVLSAHSILNIIGKSRETVRIVPSDSLFVSIKALISQTAKAGEAYRISAKLFDFDNTLISQKDIAVKIAETKKVRLMVRQQQVAMHDRGGFFNIEVYVQNEGNTPQEVVLLAILPNELQRDIPEQKAFKLKAFQDTTVVISQRITRKMMRLDNFNVHLTGLYKRGHVFGRETVRVHAIKNSRKYRPKGMGLFPQRENLFSLRAQSMGKENRVYEGRLNTSFDIHGKGEMTMNIDGTWRKNIDELYFRNTWLAYESERFGARVGNIYENKAIDLHGRGVKGFYRTKDQHSQVEIGILENSYRLFKPIGKTAGKSIWGSYSFQKHGGFPSSGATFSSSFIYEEDFYQDQQNMLLAFHGNIIDTTHLEIKGGIYGGRTSMFEEHGVGEYGVAAQLKVKAKAGNFSFSSDNFVSTGYYPGRRRGALNFNERIGLNLKKYRIWFFFNHYSYKPKYISIFQGRKNKFGSTHAQLGASKRMGRFSVSLSSTYSLEQRKLVYTDQTRDARLSAARLGMGINYSSSNYKHTFYLDTEMGFSNAESTSLDNFQFLGKFNYNWGIFHLNSSYQVGAFYLDGVLSNRYSAGSGKYKRWYVRPNVQYSFFNNKLELTAGLSYNHNSNMGGSMRVMGRAEYKLPYGLKIFMATKRYDYSYGNHAGQRIELGIIKHFSMPKFGANNSSLKIFVYKNKDGKHGYSLADEIAVNQLVHINGRIFRTNNNGLVTYNKLPEGTYAVKFNGLSSWYAKGRKVYVKKDVRIEVGLQKMTTIKGTLSYSSTILSYDINKKLGGLLVLALDGDGRTFSTRTNPDGGFVLFVPKGKYTISLIAPGMTQYVNVVNNDQLIKTTEDNLTQIKFKILVREKKVEFKKFTAN